MKLRDSLAENNSIRLRAETEYWQGEAQVRRRRFTGGCRRGGATLLQAILDGVERIWLF